MGLDMYLYAEEYVGAYDFSPKENRDAFAKMLKITGLDEIADKHETNSGYFRAVVAYWRKANAIHAWFVDNVQNGVDECQTSEVTPDHLKALLVAVTTALDAYNAGDYQKAEEALAPRSGFFFGSTEVDEWYADGLKYTKEKITALLARFEKTEETNFYYRASW